MQKKGIALHSVIPIRSQASECAEQLTQMLFAQTCDILEEQPRWTLIRLHSDQQTGWVDAKMLTPLSDDEFQSLTHIHSNEFQPRVCFPMAYAVSEVNHQTFPLTAGTVLPNFNNGSFSFLGITLKIDPTMVITTPYTMGEEQLMQATRYFLNIPYLWGGKNAMGMDCSGFSQVILSLFGKDLPRNASEQANEGARIAQLEQAQAGDLAFFDHADIDPKRTNISHVGILLDSQRIIHCSGRVKVEKIDNFGILSPDGHYTHHLSCIRRV